MKTKILKKNKGLVRKNMHSIFGGFTLIELMVATTIFSIVMLMGVGSLIVSSNSAKAAQRLRIAMDNVNFAMESMTRELRVGTHYYCGSGSVSMTPTTAVADCVSGGSVILFQPQQIGATPPARIGYYGNNNTLIRCVNDISTCTPIVASNVVVNDLRFYVRGADGTYPNTQPSVRIIMKGSVTIGGVTTPFILQSMASQRSTKN